MYDAPRGQVEPLVRQRHGVVVESSCMTHLSDAVFGSIHLHGGWWGIVRLTMLEQPECHCQCGLPQR